MPGNPNWSSVALAMHLDGADGSTAFIDMKNNTITRGGGAVISTAQSRFGGASLRIGKANTDYLEAPSTVADFGSAPFTIAGWCRPDAAAVAGAYGRAIMGNYTGAAGTWGLRFGRAANTALFFGVDAAYIQVPYVVTGDEWFYFKICRDSSGIRVYKNNALAGSTADYGSFAFGGAALPMRIGSDRDGASGMVGFLDDIIITKGVALDAEPMPTAPFVDYAAQINGAVRDDSGSPAVRTVRLHRRDTGAVVGEAQSGTDGVFAISCNYTGPCYAVCFDDNAGTQYNALIYDRVTPA